MKGVGGEEKCYSDHVTVLLREKYMQLKINCMNILYGIVSKRKKKSLQKKYYLIYCGKESVSLIRI